MVDLETTGLSPDHGATIMEIGGVRIEEGSIGPTFQEMVNPEMPIPPKITEITGIRQEDVTDAPTLDRILPEFEQFSEETIYIAHNASFDLKFLKHFSKNEFKNSSIDTLRLARRLLDFESHALTHLIKQLDLERENAHRALDDALATAELFLILAEQLSDPRDYYACNLPRCILEQAPGDDPLGELRSEAISNRKQARQFISKLLARSPERLGINKWSQILAGSSSKSIEKYNDHPGFGSMGNFSQVKIKEIIEKMVGEGTIRQTSGSYPVLVADQPSDDSGKTEEDPLSSPSGSPF